ncbi:MAG: hypothetical protein PWR23_1837 [Peptostreptococcaceae bacterium]|jgi:hypothetical protein|nr:hypothetical protein [Peptostreptococcaceae bacterium]
MITSKDYLHKLIDEVSKEEIAEIIDFVEYLKIKKEKNNMKDLLDASNSSTDFWNNEIDDEVWNNV